jgi:hypothetical protein
MIERLQGRFFHLVEEADLNLVIWLFRAAAKKLLDLGRRNEYYG